MSENENPTPPPTLHLPQNPNDWARVVIAIIITATVCYIAATGGEINTTIAAVFGSIVSFYLGLVSEGRKT